MMNVLTYVVRGLCAGVVVTTIVMVLLWIYDYVVGNR